MGAGLTRLSDATLELDFPFVRKDLPEILESFNRGTDNALHDESTHTALRSHSDDINLNWPVPCDKMSLDYRKWLKTFGMQFGMC